MPLGNNWLKDTKGNVKKSIKKVKHKIVGTDLGKYHKESKKKSKK